MRSFVLLCVFGLVATVASGPSQLLWQPGKEYVFDYSSRMLTGIPELASHYSGLGMQAQVRLVVRRTWSGGNSFTVKIEQPRFVKVNGILNPNGPEAKDKNWRNVPLPAYQEVPEEAKRFMEIPTEFDLTTGGSFSSLSVSEAEPHWSVNMKKAIVVLFQAKFAHEFDDIPGNAIPGEEHTTMVNWHTQEEGLDGVCDNYYQIQQVSPFVAITDPEMNPIIKSCNHGENMYKIIRTRDVDSCSRRTSFVFSKPGFRRCTEGNCNGMWSKLSATRYYACGSLRQLKVKSIVNEGELNQDLLGFEVEKYTTGTQQVLQLKETNDISSPPASPPHAITLSDLMYVYDSESLRNNVSVGQLDAESAKPNSLLRGNVEPHRLIEQIKSIVKELVNNDLTDLPNLPKKKVTEKTLQVARALSLLTKTDIQGVYHQLKQAIPDQQKQTTLKNIFFDMVTMGGSYENILFIKEQIETGEVETQQLASIFMFLPNYVTVPTQRVLELLFQVATSERVQQVKIVYNQAIMSLSTLVHDACVTPERKTTYPVNVYGEQCHPESTIINRHLLPYLQRQLLSERVSVEKKNVAVMALGLLGHQDIVPLLLPLIESNNTGSPNAILNNRITRHLAVYSLDRVGHQHRNLVVPNLLAVLLNPSETTDIRVAAFNTILKTEPTMAELHTIAGMTWREKNLEVVRVVFKALQSLSLVQSNSDIMFSHKSGLSLVKKAKIVLHMVKPAPESMSSRSTYSSEELLDLGVSYKRLTSWTIGKDYNSPTDFYNRMVFLLNRYQYTPCEVAMKAQGMENLIQELAELFSGSTRRQNKQEFSRRVIDQLSGEWKKVINKLDISSRDDQGTQGLLFMNLFESAPFFHSIQSNSSDMLKNKFENFFNGSASVKQLCGETQINFQKVLDASPTFFLIPSDLGFPINIEIHIPKTISATGKLSVNCNTNAVIPPVNVQLNAFSVSQYTGWVGIQVPFTEEYVMTAVDEHSVRILPAEMDIKLQPEQNQLQVNLKPLPNLNAPVDVVHFHIRPYTVIQKVWNLSPMSLNTQVKNIQSRSPAREMKKQLGDDYSIDAEAILITEAPFTGLRSYYEKFRKYHFNPLNAFYFGWVPTTPSESGKISIRRHEFQIRYNPNHSATKAVNLQVQVGYATKLREGKIRLHQLRRQENPGQVFRYPAWQNILPLKVISQDMENVQDQQTTTVNGLLKEMFGQIKSDQGRGVAIKTSVILSGSRSQVITYTATFGAGLQSLKEAWNVKLTSEKNHLKKAFCINGTLDLGQEQLPYWNLDEIRSNNFQFQFENIFGYGRTCQERMVKMTGTTKSSQNQKSFSQESPEAQLYNSLSHNQTLLDIVKVSPLMDKLRSQASTLDEIDIKVEFENVDWRAKVLNNYLLAATQDVFFPFNITNTSSMGIINNESNFENNYKIRYTPKTDTFNLTIDVDERQESIVFKNVQIPYLLRPLFPVSGLRKGFQSQSIYQPAFYQCHLRKDFLRTYENTTRRVELDNCFYLLTADCSYSKKFAVLAKSLDSQRKQLQVLVGSTKIDLIPESNSLKIKVNGTERHPSGQEMVLDLKGDSETLTAQIVKSKDNVFTVKMQYYTVVGVSTAIVHFDGKHVQTKVFPFFQGSMCGLCGDITGSKISSMRGPKQCVFSKSKLLTASYRVDLPEYQCSSLSSDIQQELQQEQQNCIKTAPIFTKVDSSYKNNANQSCIRLNHEMVIKPDEMCFSRVPAMDCKPSCRPVRDSVSMKEISFTCLENGPRAEDIAQRIRNGEIVNELKNLPESFRTKLPLPRRCQPKL